MLGFQSGEGDPTRIHRVGRIVPRQDSWCVHHRAHCKGQGGPLARGPLWYPKGWETGGGVLMSASQPPAAVGRRAACSPGRFSTRGRSLRRPTWPSALCVPHRLSYMQDNTLSVRERGCGPSTRASEERSTIISQGSEGQNTNAHPQTRTWNKKWLKKKKQKKSQLQVIDLRRGRGSCRRHSRWDIGAPAPRGNRKQFVPVSKPRPRGAGSTWLWSHLAVVTPG